MRLTKQTGHAIRILVDCACAEGQLVKVNSIAERLGITTQNVFKIVHILSHAGFLTAQRGRYGGVKLAKPASQIRIGDVVRATEVTSIEIEGEDGSSTEGGVNSVLDHALEAFISVLDQHTLEEMAASAERTSEKNGQLMTPSRRRGATASKVRPRVAALRP